MNQKTVYFALYQIKEKKHNQSIYIQKDPDYYLVVHKTWFGFFNVSIGPGVLACTTRGGGQYCCYDYNDIIVP